MLVGSIPRSSGNFYTGTGTGTGTTIFFYTGTGTGTGINFFFHTGTGTGTGTAFFSIPELDSLLYCRPRTTSLLFGFGITFLCFVTIWITCTNLITNRAALSLKLLL